MNFDFSEEQSALRDHIRRSLQKACPLTEVRRVFDDGADCSEKAWQAVIELGLPATMIGEAYGGLGLGALEMCIVAEEIGRVLAPIPFSSSLYFAAEAISTFGTEAQKSYHLPGLASGEVVGTYAIDEPGYYSSGRAPGAYMKDGLLHGSKAPVPDGLMADIAIVLARRSPDAAADDTVLVIVPLGQPAVQRVAVEMLDRSRPHAQVDFDGADADILGDGANGGQIWEAVKDRAAVLLAFEQLGGADAALEMACDYALQRKAFGRPIGSFQAIKHKVANIYIKNSLGRANAYFSAWALANNSPDLPRAAAASLLSCSDAFVFAAKENNQVHGGMSYCWETDCHFFYKRAQLLKSTLGSSLQWKEKLVSELERSENPGPESMLGRFQ